MYRSAPRSPLATATDRAGGLWWASNPEWLRELNDWHELELTNPVPHDRRSPARA